MAFFEKRLKSGGVLFALHYLGDFNQIIPGREVHDLMKRHSALEQTHSETVPDVGPRGEGYTITILRKSEALHDKAQRG